MSLYGTAANTALQGNQTFLGDITGTSQTTNVAKLQGSTLTIAAPANGNVLTYSGGTWINQAPAPATPAGATTQIQYNSAGVLVGKFKFHG